MNLYDFLKNKYELYPKIKLMRQIIAAQTHTYYFRFAPVHKEQENENVWSVLSKFGATGGRIKSCEIAYSIHGS